MNENTELDYLRDLNDTMRVQIETLQDHLAETRVEVERLTALVAHLERSVDEKAAEIIRLTVATPY